MDVSQYDPQAVANAEAKVLHEQDRCGWRRRDAVNFQRQVMAQVIADNVVSGSSQWDEQVEEYRYLRDLPWDGGIPPDLTTFGARRDVGAGVPGGAIVR